MAVKNTQSISSINASLRELKCEIEAARAARHALTDAISSLERRQEEQKEYSFQTVQTMHRIKEGIHSRIDRLEKGRTYPVSGKQTAFLDALERTRNIDLDTDLQKWTRWAEGRDERAELISLLATVAYHDARITTLPDSVRRLIEELTGRTIP